MKKSSTLQCGALNIVLAATAGFCVLVPLSASAQSPITFSQIYAAPDDQDLNLAYARQQAEAGDLVAAASALERMLYSQPNWDSARLFYAFTLYQLDDRAAAMRELSLLESRPLTPPQRAELQRYQSDFNDSGKRKAGTRPRLDGRIAIGLRYDDNAGNALGDVVFGGSKDPEIAGTVQAVARYTVPMDAAGNTRAFVRGDLQTRRHETVSEADFDVYGLEAGFAGRVGELNWQASVDVMTVNISSDSYLDQIGAKAKIRGAFTEQWVWNLSGEYYDQNFKDLPFTNGETDRTGDKYVVDAGLEYTPNDNFLIGANIAYEDKSARDNELAYGGFRLRGLARYDFNADAYARATVEYRKLDYVGNSTFLFPFAPREDENFKATAAVGMYANRILAALEIGPQNFLKPVSFELGGNYINRDTNIPGSGFKNLGGELRMIVEF